MRKLKLTTFLTAYESNPGWKKDDNGNIVLKDGNPVYITINGQEQTVDGNTIAARNAEAKAQRERAEAAEANLKKFEGIDPEIARKAVDTVKKIDAKTLIDAGKVDEVKKQITDQFTAQLTEKEGKLSEALNRINGMKIDQVFYTSELLRDGIAVPRDMLEASMRQYFKVGEDGKVEVYGKDGNRLMSKSRAGEYADPEEGLRLLIEAHPSKDQILKADVGKGSGNGGGGGHRGMGRVLKRAEFDKLPPAQQAEYAKKAGSGEISIVD